MPYTETDLFLPPQDEQAEMWRYMSFAKLTWILDKSKLHFHKPSQFADPFEGSVPKSYYELRKYAMKEELEDSNWDIDKYMESMKQAAKMHNQMICANCWHSNSRESAAMWDRYDGRAVAIVSSVENLKSALEPIDKPVYLHEIDYVDFDAGADEITLRDKSIIDGILDRAGGPNMHLPYMLKRIEYSHENEVRAITYHGEDWEEDGWDSGVDLTVDVEDLINRVQISPHAPDWLSSSVEFTMDNCCHDLDRSLVFESALDDDPVYMGR
jgi:hypothetical protein